MSKTFEQLSNFISTTMRMSHIYQPVMLIELLRKNGEATVSEIAQAILLMDPSQADYYEQITLKMPGKVLTTNHKITSKTKNTYTLPGFNQLTSGEVTELIKLCNDRINTYQAARSDPWSHRRKSTGYVSGSLKYEVLKRAHGRCELCGVSKDKKALEVDHIVPRSLQGTDDLSNLQALCYSCNAMKQNRDNTDFRSINEVYEIRDSECVFCQPSHTNTIEQEQNELCYALNDAFPVTPLHTLVIPRRHVSDFFDLYQPELNAINALLFKTKSRIQKTDPQVTGFNIGINAGHDAGQTIFHCHVHLIPRRPGDVNNPRGGVRGVLPLKQQY